MGRLEIESALIDLIKEVSKKTYTDNFDEDTDLRYALKIDSLNIVELIIKIEEKFNIEFDDNILGTNELYKYSCLRDYLLTKIEK